MASAAHIAPPDPGGACILGLRAERGRALCVGVALAGRAPRLVVRRTLALGSDGEDRAPATYATMMAEVEAGLARAAALAAIAEARSAMARAAGIELQGLAGDLAAAGWPRPRAVLLVNRAGWVADVDAYGLSGLEHARVADRLAVREAVRAGLRTAALAWIETDEKSLRDKARASGLTAEAEEAGLRAIGAAAGKPWRAEWKAACLAAWVEAVASA